MKKFAFTLAEVLISMTIIGVVASITAPTLINMMPNEDKVQTIKYQKLISEINADLLNNRTLYSNGEWDNKKILVPEYTNTVFINQTNRTKLNMNKYAYLLMEKLEGVTPDSATTYTESKVVFKTLDGYQWTVKTNNEKPSEIIIDTDGEGSENDPFGKQSNKYPNRFKFKIDNNGYANCDEDRDPITCRYLNCPFYMNNRKLDYKCMNTYSGECACQDN